jgi:hypothetical protein
METAELQPGEVWSDRLPPGRKILWQIRTSEPPSLWPPAMRDGVAELAKSRRIYSGEDMVELMAEWMVRNPDSP